MDLSLFDYDLPREYIAQHPPEKRGTSRMMVVPLDGSAFRHTVFSELPEFLEPGDCLVLNDTRVIPARLIGRRPTGGESEVFLLECVEGDCWRALVRPARRMGPGTEVNIGDTITATVLQEPQDGETTVKLEYEGDFADALEQAGQTPLPPYIHRDEPHPEDRHRYQTIYADESGAVAAPTAGLHFTEEILQQISDKGIRTARLTLHVGLGTFQPITSPHIENHDMHSERYEVSLETAETINATRAAGGRIIAVGTTVVRTLETCVDEGGVVHASSGATDLYITPGYRFKAIDGLLTNFHLPKSSLLVMVSALAGRRRILAAYEEAIQKNYRFYSYGDCMLII
ncbi:MAG: tRNA preQ1(34) S-adenosylmethionine ribosyltransferase-isomerase QueA [Armatimonadota bacterium]